MLQPKSHSALPRANQDGGGITSLPDWSSPPPGQKDRLQGLRSLWSDWLAAKHIPVRLRSHVQSGSEDPLFTPAEVVELRSLTSTWFTSQGVPDVSWEIPEFQPYAPALQSLAKLIQDPDESLWPCLLEGVPTGIGIDANSPKANVFSSFRFNKVGKILWRNCTFVRATGSRPRNNQICWLNLWTRRPRRVGSSHSPIWQPP